MTRQSTSGSRFYACEIFAALMHNPRSLEELCEQVGVSDSSGRKWIKELRKSGIVRICGFMPTPKRSSGARKRIYCLQLAPFALPDAVYRPEAS